MSSLFFTSYAHANRDKLLERFVNELADEVFQRLQGVDREDVVFFDAKKIESGVYWRDKLASELRSCKACVAICSPAFVASRFCGKELRVFLDRITRWENSRSGPDSGRRPVIAVLWVRPDEDAVPAILARFQYTEGDFPEVYTDDGLRTMYSLSKYAQRRKALVIALAKRIASATRAVDLPEADALPDFDQISSALHDESQPVVHGVAFLPLVKGGNYAQPYSDVTLGELMNKQCQRLIHCRVLTGDAKLATHLRSAREGREVTIVVTDLETLTDPLYQKVVQDAASALAAPAAIVVRRDSSIATPAQEQNIKITVETAFAAAIGRGALVDWTSSRSLGTFEQCLARVIERLRKALMEQLTPSAARDEGLSNQAASEGIQLAIAPSFAAPRAS